MSTILTLSKFYYGHLVNSTNKSLDFNEGGSELQASLKVGAYSLTEYGAEIQRAMRAVGSQNYVVALDRVTRKFTISAPSNFTLLASTGSRIGTGCWSLLGATATNKTGTNTYTLENGSGSVYSPQYYIFDYLAEADNIVLEDATVDATPLGIAQVSKFGDGARITMNIRLISNLLTIKNTGFIPSATGKADFMTFMTNLMNKGRVEFMPDVGTTSQFTKCYLESTKDDKEARRFALKQMTMDVFESGLLIFRKVLT